MKKLFTLIAAALMAVGVSAEETELWSSVTPVKVDWGSADIKIAPEKLTSVKAGDILHVYITDVNTSGGEWGAQVALKDGNYTDLEAGVPVGKGDLSKVEFTITGDILALAKANSLQISGNNYSVTKVTYETGAAEGSAQSVWVGNSTGNVTINANHFKNANGGDGPKAGDIIRVKATAIAGYTKDTYIILSYSGEDTSWSWKNYEGMDATTVDGGFEFAVTEANIAQIKTDGIIVNQGGYTITEVQFPAPAASEGGETSLAINYAEMKAGDFTVENAQVNATESKDTKTVYDIEANQELKFWLNTAPSVVFTITNGGAKSKIFNVNFNDNTTTDKGSVEFGGKNGVVIINDAKVGDEIKMTVAAKGSTAGKIGVLPSSGNDLITSTELALPKKDKEADGADAEGYVWKEFSFKVTEDMIKTLESVKVVRIKETDGGYRCKALSINAPLPTGIQNIKAATKTIENNVIYNLAGQKVNENYKGIVIKNGKKFIQK